MPVDCDSHLIRVDSGVPLPGRNRGSGPASLYPWASMKVGDSFVWPDKGNPTVAQKRAGAATSMRARKYGEKYATRCVEENGVRIVRVWRVA